MNINSSIVQGSGLSANSATVHAAPVHVNNWATAVNLKVNRKKTQEMIVWGKGAGRRKLFHPNLGYDQSELHEEFEHSDHRHP